MTTKSMTKPQLIAALAQEMHEMGSVFDKETATNALNATTSIIMREVASGGAVTLPGIGKFFCRERPEREVRNPATGEKFMKDADKVVKVTIAKALKDSINS